MRDLEHRSQSLGIKSMSHIPIFLIFFFLFFFFFILVCTGPKYLYQPKQTDFACTVGIFFGKKQGVYLYRCIGRYDISAVSVSTVRKWLPCSEGHEFIIKVKCEKVTIFIKRTFGTVYLAEIETFLLKL